MNIIRFFNYCFPTYYGNPIDDPCNLIIEAPEEHYAVTGSKYIITRFNNERVTKPSFSSVASWFSSSPSYVRGSLQCMVVSSNDALYMRPDCIFKRLPDGRKELCFLLCTTGSHEYGVYRFYNRDYKAFVTYDFITDTKHPIFNGIKHHVLRSIDHLKIEAMESLDSFVSNPASPTSLDYQTDISNFLKSDDVQQYIREY